MKPLIDTLNWTLYYFNKFLKFLLVSYIRGFLLLILFFVVCVGPAMLFWEHENFVMLWVLGVFLASIFGSILYLVYREQEEPEVIETVDGITFINDPDLPPRKERIKIAIRHTWHWFILGIVIISYLFYLFIRFEGDTM